MNERNISCTGYFLLRCLVWHACVLLALCVFVCPSVQNRLENEVRTLKRRSDVERREEKGWRKEKEEVRERRWKKEMEEKIRDEMRKESRSRSG